MRTRRGPHPADHDLFHSTALPRLREAVDHFAWLSTHGYAGASALKLVGDRFALAQRQRVAVRRATCSDQALVLRRAHELRLERLARTVVVDGFNVVTTLEVALGGGVVLRCRDGCLRDLAGVHGTWHHVRDTAAVLDAIGQTLVQARCEALWYLDRPVSNSGRLKDSLLAQARARGYPWRAELVADPDLLLIDAPDPVATSDSRVLDGCAAWVNLAAAVLEAHVPQAWIVDLAAS